MSQVPKNEQTHFTPKFYGVYLLRSVPKPNSFYIGSTPDPVRRLRQHNGDLKAGAYKTKRKGFRPWDMVMIIYGFPNKISALQFEHAWQHSYQTRHIESSQRIVNNKSGGRSLHHKVGNAKLLLNAPFFKRMSLKIMCFDETIYQAFVRNKFNIKFNNEEVPLDYVKYKSNPEYGNLFSVENFKDIYMEKHDESMKSFKDLFKREGLPCSLCDSTIDYNKPKDALPLISICYHSDCLNIAHLSCLYKYFKEQAQVEELLPSQSQRKIDEDIQFKSLIPSKGKCPKCDRFLIWTDLIKYSTWIKAEIGFNVNIQDFQKEFDEDSAEE
ncbi:hypothetical protein WICMUC_004211 [Wickerhamomyces mucosus]|uniref:GIY-YIG domain-containing protein n=1 Tax=Wickerhamomyces mucosus TaxID=1378264 RepID=A0A9P8TB22_9ASCO|nr:hypothetical protein WICMUC_004211 [Wickerhamomyces mucosus]